MRYRCIKLTEDAWAKAFTIGQDYEKINGIISPIGFLTLKSGVSQFTVPNDCFYLIKETEEPPTEQLAPVEELNPLDKQEGGSHYKDMNIQPVEFIMANGLDYIQGNVIKYVVRYKHKNGLEDLKKARHYIDILIKENELH